MLTLCKEIRQDNLLCYLIANQYRDIEVVHTSYRISEKLSQKYKYVHGSSSIDCFVLLNIKECMWP